MTETKEDYWRRLYSSLKDQFDRLEKSLVEQGASMRIMALNLENAQKAVDINKAMLRQITEEANAKEQEYIGLINRLKDKLREFGYADFNNLGN